MRTNEIPAIASISLCRLGERSLATRNRRHIYAIRDHASERYTVVEVEYMCRSLHGGAEGWRSSSHSTLVGVLYNILIQLQLKIDCYSRTCFKK